MAGIITATLTASGEGSNQCLRLGNGEIARGLAIGSNWNKIAIGLRVRMTRNVTIGSGNYFRVGVCNGPAGFIAPVSHSYYVRLGLPYIYNSTNKVYNIGSSCVPGRNIGAGEVMFGFNVSSNPPIIAASDANGVTPLLVSITKDNGSGNFSVGLVAFFSANPSTYSMNLDEFELGVEQKSEQGADSSWTVSANTAATASTRDTTFVVDEATYGPLNNIFIQWPISDPALDIADVVVADWS